MPSPLRIFVSSPGDVREERLRAQLIIAKLTRDYAGLVDLQPYFWESEPLRASAHFQDEIKLPSQHDIVVLILWSRLGTPLPTRTAVRTYTGMDGRTPVTGTEWEFENALAAFQLRSTPDLLVYRRSGDPGTSLTNATLRAEQERQWQALQDFWARHFENRGEFLAASTRYDSLEAFDERLEADLAKLIERRLAALADGGAVAHLKGAPYRGLLTYDFADAPVFFGRDGAIRTGLLRLSEAAEMGCSFLVVLGASGSGKSSLARAGLLPALVAAKAIPGVGLWRRVVMRPGDVGTDPIAALAGALLSGSPTRGEGLAELAGPGAGAAELARHLRVSTDDASYPFRTALGALAIQERKAKALLEHEEARLVLLVDQLEELFTRTDITEDDRCAFVRVLTGLARSGVVWIIATMRSDLWHRAAAIPELLRLTEDGARLDLLPPNGAELLEVIRRPARATGLTFEENEARIGLDAVLAEAAAAEPGALPLLSVVLEDLYRNDVVEHGNRSLTFAGYRAMGELKGAIATRAELAWAGIAAHDPQSAAALPEVLRALITSNTGEAVTSRPSRLDAFTPASPARRLIEALLAPDIRLLTAEGDERQTSLRLSHEALIEHWPRARTQIQADRRDIETRSRLESLLKRYEDAPAGGQRSRALLTGLPLEEGIDLTLRWAISPATALGAFVANSARRARRRRSLGYAFAACIVLLFAGIAGIAGWQAQLANERTTEAQLERIEADRQRKIATQREQEAQTEKERADAQRLQAEQARSSAELALLRANRESAMRLVETSKSALGRADATSALSAALQAAEISTDGETRKSASGALLASMIGYRELELRTRPTLDVPWPFAFRGEEALLTIEKEGTNDASMWSLRQTSLDASRDIREAPLPSPGNDNLYYALRLIEDQSLAIAVSGGQLSLVDINEFKLLKTYKFEGSISDVSISNTRNAIGILTNNEVIVIDAQKKSMKIRFQLPEFIARGNDFSFSLDALGTTAYFVGEGALHTFNLTTKKHTKKPLISKDAEEIQTSVGALMVLPSGTQMLAGGQTSSIAPQGQIPRLINFSDGSVRDVLGNSTGAMISSSATAGLIVADPDIEIYRLDPYNSDRNGILKQSLPIYIDGVAVSPERCEASSNMGMVACAIDRRGEQNLLVSSLKKDQATFLQITKFNWETGRAGLPATENQFMTRHSTGVSKFSQNLVNLQPPEHIDAFYNGSRRSTELGFPDGTAVYENAENGSRYIGNCSGQVIAVSNSGARLWTTNRRTDDETETCSLRTTGYISSISPSASGRYLYVSVYNEPNLLIIDTDSGSLLASIQGEGWPFYVKALDNNVVGIIWGNAGTEVTTPETAIAYVVPEGLEDIVTLARDKSVFGSNITRR